VGSRQRRSPQPIPSRRPYRSQFKRFVDRDFDFYSRWYLKLREAAASYRLETEAVYYNADANFTLQYTAKLAPIIHDAGRLGEARPSTPCRPSVADAKQSSSATFPMVVFHHRDVKLEEKKASGDAVKPMGGWQNTGLGDRPTARKRRTPA
jgi:hypothetical protein